jgi:hypothetical protein
MAGSMRWIIVVPCLLAASVLAACDRRESAWRDARRENSQSAYLAYLEQYPTGVHAAEARAELEARRAAQDWARADRLGTPEAWQRYLGEWPEGLHAREARRRLVAFIPPEPPAPATGAMVGHVVQLGAWSTEDAARTGLAASLERHPAELAGFELRIVPPRQADGTLWRLRTGLLDETAARDLCAKLRAVGVDCVTLTESSAGHQPG